MGIDHGLGINNGYLKRGQGGPCLGVGRRLLEGGCGQREFGVTHIYTLSKVGGDYDGDVSPLLLKGSFSS